MEQESKKINPAEEYNRVSVEYCARMREYIDGIEAELKEVPKHLDMNDPYHANALRVFTFDVLYAAEKEMKKIGSDYEREVGTLRNIVN